MPLSSPEEAEKDDHGLHAIALDQGKGCEQSFFWRGVPPSAIVGRGVNSREQAPGSVHGGTPVLRAGELADGASRKFVLEHDGRKIDCFVVRFRGMLHAYVNECRHIAMTLDWVENQFFTEEGDLLLCPTHGALYLPDTGECIAGPPCGKSLRVVRLVEASGWIWALPPEAID